MFIVKENIEQKDRLDKLYRVVKKIFGFIPPQTELLGNIEASYLEDYITMVTRIIKQKNIERNLFTFLRLHIAFREDYDYCKGYNTKVLLSSGYTQELLDNVINDIEAVPFNDAHKALAKFAIKAIYEPKECKKEDYEEIYKMGWSQKEVFDVVEHAGTLLKNGRILSAYWQKS
jgi:hypothetical protein